MQPLRRYLPDGMGQLQIVQPPKMNRLQPWAGLMVLLPNPVRLLVTRKKKPVFQLGAYKPLVVVGGRVEQQVPENLFVGSFDGRRLLRSVLFADPFQLL
jgi:hypothetical protein